MPDYVSICRAELPGEALRFDAPMSEYTTFRAGGPADVLFCPRSEDELVHAVRLARERCIPMTVIGNGSNLLVKDSGIRGLVIRLGDGFSDISCEGETICAQSGATLSKLASKALSEELTGLEFASGIPGSVGGGVAMNAGAYGGQLSDVFVSCRVISTLTGEVFTLDASQCAMGYRTTRMLTSGEIVMSAVFGLKKGEKSAIKATMDDLNARRRDKQPLAYPSAGSTFKRPEGYFAGALIEQAGLKGFTIGGAQVSEKHAGFIINVNNATAQNILDLINEVQKRVFEMSGVMLEPEVRILG